jgi:hypothetical protein
MAAGDSDVSICNLGLTALGQDTITTLTDNRKAAILCNQRYGQIRREVLRANPWGFARKRDQLPAAATAPAFGCRTAFTLPSDFIRLVDVPEVCARRGWMIEGRQLLADETAPLNLLYIYDCQDATVFDPLFVAALGYAMAVELAMPLTQDRGLKVQMENEMAGKLATARLVSSQDNSAMEYQVDILLEARH